MAVDHGNALLEKDVAEVREGADDGGEDRLVVKWDDGQIINLKHTGLGCCFFKKLTG